MDLTAPNSGDEAYLSLSQEVGETTKRDFDLLQGARRAAIELRQVSELLSLPFCVASPSPLSLSPWDSPILPRIWTKKVKPGINNMQMLIIPHHPLAG